jgi:hypothetical protein
MNGGKFDWMIDYLLLKMESTSAITHNITTTTTAATTAVCRHSGEGIQPNCAHFDSVITDILIYLFNLNWVAIRWQQYSTYLRTNNTQNTENVAYITIKKLNIHNNTRTVPTTEHTNLNL